MDDSKGIMVFSENNDLELEIVGKARELADKLQAEVSAMVIGNNIRSAVEELGKFGVGKVFVCDNPSLEKFQPEPYFSVLHKLVSDQKPEIVLFGSTKNGKLLAARLATRLDVGCIPDCTKLDVDDQGRLVGERMTYGGNAVAKITFQVKPQIVTVPARAFEKPQPRSGKAEVVKVEAQLDTPKIEIVETKPLETSNVRIEDANVIVSCGRGLQKKEDKSLLDDVSSVLCGQVGCSRPLAEDRKWFSEWVGLSGHKVRPKLYIACGISGVIQHVAGIRDAKVIVAINKDEQAPIFEMADYAVVGDLYQILPALTEALRKQIH